MPPQQTSPKPIQIPLYPNPCVRAQSLCCGQFSETPWTIARQAPLSMGFFRLEYWSGLPFPSPGNLPNPGIKPRSPALQADSLLTEVRRKPHELEIIMVITNVH